MKHFFVICLLIGSVLSSFAQDTYVRPSVSLANFNFSDANSSLNLGDVEVPANLDATSLSKNKFSINGAMSSVTNEQIIASFINAGGAIAAISAIAPANADGSDWDMDAILSRAEYSATDQDVNLTSQTIRGTEGSGSRYLDIVNKMLAKNYVLAFNMGQAKSYTQKNINGRTVGRGFKQDLTYYVLKISDPFVANPELTPSTLSLANIDVSVITSATASLTAVNLDASTKKKSNTELKNELKKSLLDAAWAGSMQNVDGWKPKTTLERKKRIALGTKENLKIDNRFFVYENVQNELGEVVKKKRSTMRVRKVGNNDGVSTGNSARSVLYKIGPGKAKEGMLVEQNEDSGVGISVGYGTFSWMRFDMRLKGIMPGLMAFVDIHPYPGKVELDMDAYLSGPGLAPTYSSLYGGLEGTFTALAANVYAGLEKQMRLTPGLYLSPFVGAGYSVVELTGSALTFGNGESLNWDAGDTGLMGGQVFGQVSGTAGGRVGLQLSADLSVNFTAAYVVPVIGGWTDAALVYTGSPDDVLYNLGYSAAETDQDYLESYYNNVIKEMPAMPDGLEFTVMLRYEF